MKIALILAPYDSGHHQSGMGRGPEAIVAGGLVDELTLQGHDVMVQDIGTVGAKQGREIATGFAVAAAIANKVRKARDEDRFPVVLAGNCLTCCGALAGDSADALVWVDQHGDLNTPETSESGFLDGMALATALGLCWQSMAASIPGFQPLDPARCLLVDARDLDEAEKRLVRSLPVPYVSHCSQAHDEAAALKAAGATRVHLHLDLDVTNGDDFEVNRYVTPGGPTPDEVVTMAAGLARALPICGITLSAYDPAYDPKGAVPAYVGRILTNLTAALERI